MLNERLGINVKKYRKAEWMTQEQLANLSGISLTEIRAIERFRANPSLNTVELVAKALGGRFTVRPSEIKNHSLKIVIESPLFSISIVVFYIF